MIFTSLKAFSTAWLALALVTCSHTEDPVKETKTVEGVHFPTELQENSGMTEYAGFAMERERRRQ